MKGTLKSKLKKGIKTPELQRNLNIGYLNELKNRNFKGTLTPKFKKEFENRNFKGTKIRIFKRHFKIEI